MACRLDNPRSTPSSEHARAYRQCCVEGMIERITPRQFHEAKGVEDWRVVGEGACTYFLTGSFAAGARLIAQD